MCAKLQGLLATALYIMIYVFYSNTKFSYFVEKTVEGVEKIHILLWNIVEFQFVV